MVKLYSETARFRRRQGYGGQGDSEPYPQADAFGKGREALNGCIVEWLPGRQRQCFAQFARNQSDVGGEHGVAQGSRNAPVRRWPPPFTGLYRLVPPFGKGGGGYFWREALRQQRPTG